MLSKVLRLTPQEQGIRAKTVTFGYIPYARISLIWGV